MKFNKSIIIFIISAIMLMSCQSSNENELVRTKELFASKFIVNYKIEKPIRDSQETNNKDVVQHSQPILLNIKQSIQENSYYCGPANIQMILNYYGIFKSQDELAVELKTHKITGTEYIDMATVLNKYLFDKNPVSDSEPGYRIQTMSIHDQDSLIRVNFDRRVRNNIANGYPTIIALNMNKLYADMPVANHVVLCTGYSLKEGSDEIAYYYIIDPYDKVQDAKYKGLKKFTPAEIIEAMVENEEPAYVW